MNNKLRILTIEDSEDDALLLMRELRLGGYETVYERVDTREAMNAALDKQEWDIVISDYSMPHFNGTEALKLLKEKGIDIPFIIVSGKIGEETAVEMMKAGAHDYIIKGNLARLIPAVERGLKEAEMCRESRLAEEKLRESEEFNRRIIESSNDCIEVLDLEGRLQFMSRGGQQMMEIENIMPYLNKFWVNLWEDADRESVREAVSKAVEGNRGYFHGCRSTVKGAPKWCEVIVTPITGAQGRIERFLAVSRDVTKRKRLESQLMRLHKMEALSRIARGVEHNFNNVLTALTAYGNMLKMKIKNDDSLSHNVDRMLALTEEATGLIGSLLAFSKNREIRPIPVLLNSVVSKAEKLILNIINHDIELELEYTDENPAVLADDIQIEQVLINLTANARDAITAGGLLTIKTELVEMDSNYINTFGYGKPGIYALISVTDNGAGMDEETKAKIFEPFFTTKETGKGMGLGLSIVYEIVKQHNGYINVFSEQGKGTTFKIYLPVVTPGIEEIKSTYPDTMAGSTETILVAGGMSNNKKNIKNVLEEFGYKVIDAVNGKDAMEKFLENKDRIKLVLLDKAVSENSGKDVYAEISKIKPDVKTIFISDYTADIIRQGEMFEKETNCLLNPFSPKELLKKVREVLLT